MELSKKNGPYNLRIIFNAKTPASFEEDEQGEQEQEQADFAEIMAYINK